MKSLHISNTFTLPLEAVTETFLDLGQRGAGKTNTAAVIAEELFAHGAPFAVLTPIDVWWGLKSSADGKGPGLPVYIFGGQHADLPLAPTAGRLMADVLIEQRISCVICTQGFSGKERAAFTTDFAERLLDKNREPLHLIVEEADAFIPQRPFPGEERMLGAMDRLIRWGRSPSAIGGTFISQRSAKINKDITTQCSVLVAHRTMAPQDVEAIKEWFKYHPDTEKQKQLLAEIASLPKGMVFLYSPAWLEYFGKCQIRRRHTFDSAATPKLGARLIEPKTAVVDLKLLEEKMAATIEKVKADDPKELRKQILALKQEIVALKQAAPAPAAKPERVEVPILTDDDRKLLRASLAVFEQALGATEAVRSHAVNLQGLVESVTARVDGLTARSVKPVNQPAARPLTSPPVKATSQSATSNGDLSGPEHRIIDAIAWMESIGIDAPEQTAVAFLAGYTYGGGAFNNPRGSLRTKGLVEYSGDRLRLTEAGRSLATAPDTPLTTAELHRMILGRLPGPEQRILTVLLQRYPDSISNEDCARESGYEPYGGAYNNPRGRLRKLGLIDYPERGTVRARDILFID